MAQNERENIEKRQAQGIAAAKARGIKFGRPKAPVPADFATVVEQWKKKQLSADDVLKQCGMSESTFYRRLREFQLLEKQ